MVERKSFKHSLRICACFIHLEPTAINVETLNTVIYHKFMNVLHDRPVLFHFPRQTSLLLCVRTVDSNVKSNTPKSLSLFCFFFSFPSSPKTGGEREENLILRFFCLMELLDIEITPFLQNVLELKVCDEDTITRDDELCTVLFDIDKLTVGRTVRVKFQLNPQVSNGISENKSKFFPST